MKNYLNSFFLLMSLILVSGVLYSQTAEPQKIGAIIIFEETTHDFGDITQGEKIEYTFKFKNAGTQPLILADVVTTCSCTATYWTKEPILPGKMGEIRASFDSAGKMGRQNKVITIVSNATNSPARVTMVSNVLQPK